MGQEPSPKPNAIQLWTPAINPGEKDPLLLPSGTGTLLTYGNRQFLCTAAHNVAREPIKQVLVGADDCFPIEKPFTRNITTLNVDYDPVDFAVVELSDNQSSRITETARFVNLDPDTPEFPSMKRLGVSLFGFLQSLNANEGLALSAQALNVPAILDERHLNLPKFQKQRRMFIGAVVDRRDRNFENNPLFQGQMDFGGLSGGPWFYSEPFLPNYYAEFAGITLECRTKVSSGVFRFVGLKARAILVMLHHWFDGLPAPRKPAKVCWTMKSHL